MKNRSIIGIAALLFSTSITAQESRIITLKEAIDLTLAYNKKLKVNKVKIEEASASIKEAY